MAKNNKHNAPKTKKDVNNQSPKNKCLDGKKSNRGCKGVDIGELVRKIYFDADLPKGLNNVQLSAYFNISEASFYNFLNINADFLEAIKFYNGESHLEVLKSFKNLACGYSFVEQEKELRRDKESGEYKLTVTKEIKKHIPANATAGLFYLKNKMPTHFKDKIEQEHTFTGGLENITFIIKGKEK